MSEGSSIAPVNFPELQKRMAAAEDFEMVGGANVAWCDPGWSISTVPILSNSVRYLCGGRPMAAS